jgi:cyanoexosortase A
MDTLEKLKEPKYWLMGIGTALIALHLTVLSKLDNTELFTTAILFWAVIISLLWDKQRSLTLESGSIPTVVGAALIALVLLRSLSPAGYHTRVAPVVSMLGLGLMASGFKGIRQYWQELLILSMLVITPFLGIILQILDLPTQTAKFSTFLLHYIGFDVVRYNNVFIALPPKGVVQVYGACAGANTILQMLNVSVLFLMLVPLRWSRQVITVIIAVLTGFVVNSGRVVLLAILHSRGQQAAFDYWHEEGGSLVFFVIAVLVFGGFCWFAFLRERPKDLESL